jgi:hypothetical protein
MHLFSLDENYQQKKRVSSVKCKASEISMHFQIWSRQPNVQ